MRKSSNTKEVHRSNAQRGEKERIMGWWKAKHSLKWASKKARRACVCVVGRELSQKAVFVPWRLPCAIIESTCQSEVCGELCEWGKTASAHTGLGWTHSYSNNKHSAFALLKPQHSRIAVQPGSVADVSLRNALNLCLVGKLRIIGFNFASVVDLKEVGEQRRRWLNCCWDTGKASYKGLT